MNGLDGGRGLEHLSKLVVVLRTQIRFRLWGPGLWSEAAGRSAPHRMDQQPPVANSCRQLCASSSRVTFLIKRVSRPLAELVENYNGFGLLKCNGVVTSRNRGRIVPV